MLWAARFSSHKQTNDPAPAQSRQCRLHGALNASCVTFAFRAERDSMLALSSHAWEQLPQRAALAALCTRATALLTDAVLQRCHCVGRKVRETGHVHEVVIALRTALHSRNFGGICNTFFGSRSLRR